jgi:hypothetical protein
MRWAQSRRIDGGSSGQSRKDYLLRTEWTLDRIGTQDSARGMSHLE